MLTNFPITIYHKTFDSTQRLEKWTRFNYDEAWIFGGKGASINKGYDNANDVDVRLSYLLIDDLNINNFKIGDIIVKGHLTLDINIQQDLKDYLTYNITSINDNNFGTKPHIHIGGR